MLAGVCLSPGPNTPSLTFSLWLYHSLQVPAWLNYLLKRIDTLEDQVASGGTGGVSPAQMANMAAELQAGLVPGFLLGSDFHIINLQAQNTQIVFVLP